MPTSDVRVPVIKKELPPKRGSRKLLYLLLVFFVTVLVILFFRSSISKISTIEISGNDLVTTEAIGQAAGVKTGDNFFLVRSSRIEQRVRSLPSVESVVVGKRFPGVLSIQIKEHPKVAYQLQADGTWKAMLADGSAVAVDGKATADKPLLSNWNNDDPMLKKLCRTLSGIPDAYLSDISEITPDPSEAYPDKIKMYTRSQFEVYTTIQYLPKYIGNLGDMIQYAKDQNKSSGVIMLLEQPRLVSEPEPSPTPAGSPAPKSGTGKPAETKANSAKTSSPDPRINGSTRH